MIKRMIAYLVPFLDDATTDFRVSFQVSTDQKEGCRDTILCQFRQEQRSVIWVRSVIKSQGDLLFLGFLPSRALAGYERVSTSLDRWHRRYSHKISPVWVSDSSVT